MSETDTESWRKARQAFAVPGEDSIIDMVHPKTGRSMVYDETLEEIRARYPGAEIIDFAQWIAAKIARQRVPITWALCSRERYWQMLEILPPAAMCSGGFLVGEPTDHDAASGAPRFQAFHEVGDHHYEASRPMTQREFLALVG